MEFIPKGKHKSYKCHGKVALRNEVYEGSHPPTSQGKPYQLTSLQHQQVRLWGLRHSEENTEWEEKYKAYIDTLAKNQGASVRITFHG
ncbi:hypothetical protein MKX01_021819 [Papaver californicum]|nr:hypothetical protein MKX01_021819 [Papaver californicum]